MRGTFFQKPLEVVLELEGESWSQGDSIQGSLSLKAMGDQATDLSEYTLGLIYGEPKKMLKNDPKAFEVLQSLDFEKESLPLEKEISFKLNDHAPISEKSKGVFLVFGKKDELNSASRLELPIKPKKTILQFLEVFETFERFKTKAVKNKKGFLEYKMLAPTSKDFAAVDSLALEIKEEEGKLFLNYTFKVKKLEYSEAGVQSADKKLSFKDVLEKKQYQLFGDSVNQDGIRKALSSVLDQVKSKTTY